MDLTGELLQCVVVVRDMAVGVTCWAERRSSILLVLTAGFSICAGIYVAGVLGVWPWQVVRENIVLAAWPLAIQAMAFALPAGAVVAAACLASGRRTAVLAFACGLAVCGLQIGFVADWLIVELRHAEQLRTFMRDNPGTIIDRFDGGPGGTAIRAMIWAATYSLVPALAALLAQGLVRVLKRVAAVRAT